jgi:hypothetical protein
VTIKEGWIRGVGILVMECWVIGGNEEDEYALRTACTSGGKGFKGGRCDV